MENCVFEDLSADSADWPNECMSSLEQIKRGPKRGRRKPETTGVWIYMGGHCDDAPREVRATNSSWARKMLELGYRVGTACDGDCTSYYVFKKNEEKS